MLVRSEKPLHPYFRCYRLCRLSWSQDRRMRPHDDGYYAWGGAEFRVIVRIIMEKRNNGLKFTIMNCLSWSPHFRSAILFRLDCEYDQTISTKRQYYQDIMQIPGKSKWISWWAPQKRRDSAPLEVWLEDSWKLTNFFPHLRRPHANLRLRHYTMSKAPFPAPPQEKAKVQTTLTLMEYRWLFLPMKLL